MRDQDRTLSPARRMTAAEWRREAERRVELDLLYSALEIRLRLAEIEHQLRLREMYARLEAHLRRLDVEAEIEDAVTRAVAGHWVSIPASADDFRRSVEDFYREGVR